MRKYQFKCELLTDVIITSMAATEGYKESLDYIPGSKFLGIVAGSLYDEANEKRTLDLFHNGAVRFGDATLMVKDEVLNKVPFSWFHEKGKNLSGDIFLHHRLSTNDHEVFRKQKIQLKQARNGYFSAAQENFFTLEQDFSLKSAHDTKMRKSKDGNMFGYYSLKSGSTWSFYVYDQSGDYIEDIKSALTGKHRIGRSRTAEFGLVEISLVKECSSAAEVLYNEDVVIYAQSNLCFYNESVQTTAIPTAFQLTGLKDATILWDKSQVRSRNYKIWNRHRNNTDPDRIIVERGSVFVVKSPTKISSTFFISGLGSHKNEGFGSVLVNPSFLVSETNKLPFSLHKAILDYTQHHAKEKGVYDEEILASLISRKKRTDLDYIIDQKVNEFIKKHEYTFKGISKSQWGTLRNYGKNNSEKEKFETMVFHENMGILYKGQSENDWRTKNRRGILKDYLKTLDPKSEYLSFVVKLSNQMAKK